MVSSTSRSISSQDAIRRRPAWKKVVLWCGMAMVLLVLWFEWNMRRHYESSLADLRSAIGGPGDGDGARGIPAAEIDHHIKGFPVRNERSMVGALGGTVPEVPSGKKIAYRWPSLIGTYIVEVTVDKGGQARAVDSLEAEPQQAQPQEAGRTLQRRPTTGVAKARENTVDLAAMPTIDLHAFGCGSLGRELVRQSLLIAARDEMGLLTRDDSLGELVLTSDGPEAFPFQLRIQMQEDVAGPIPQLRFRISLSRAAASGDEFVWLSSELNVPKSHGVVPFLERVESLSRVEFVEALKKAGLKPSPTSGSPLAEIAEGFDGHLDFVSQFAAVRHAHARRLADGESAENLGALVRGYANLGNLIEFHWSPASKAFKARALLYAQRLVVKHQLSKGSLAHRAYALALCGHHGLAIKDSQAARSTDGADVPDWLSVVDAFCAYQSDGLDATQEPYEELACYLKMKMIDPDYDRKNCIAAAVQFAELNPACCSVPERMCEIGEVGVVRLATESIADRVWPGVYEKLTQIPDLPRQASDIAQKRGDNQNPREEARDRVRLIAALRQEAFSQPDVIQPAWSSLAEIISDATLIQCWRVVHAEKYTVGVPTGDSIQQLAPLIKGHPFEKCLECYSDEPRTAIAATSAMAAIAEQLPAELASATFTTFTSQSSPDFYERIHTNYVKNWDPIFPDLLKMNNSISPALQDAAAGQFLEVSPDQPRSVVMAINSQWEKIRDQADAWELKYASSAPALAALGMKYRELFRSEDAIRCLRKSLEVSPAHYVYFALVAEYREREETDAQRETLERATKLQGSGLEQSQASIELAQSYMQEGKWDEAHPHAMAAAETYSAGGLITAAQCAEGQEDWETSENFMQAVSTRYESLADKWYLWCIRLGRGNIAAAREVADQGIWERMAPPYDYQQMWSRTFRDLFEGDVAAARKTLSEVQYSPSEDVYVLLIASLLADRMGDVAAREACYRKIEVQFDPTYALPSLVNLYRRALRDSQKLQWPRRTFDELAAIASSDDVAFLYYCAGEFLEIHGEHELGREYLQCAATTSNTAKLVCPLACHELRQLKIPVGPARFHSRPDSWFPWFEFLSRGRRAVKERKFDLAREAFDEAVRMNPESTIAYIERGQLNESHSDYAAAIRDYELVLTYDLDCERAHLELAGLRAYCEQEAFRDGAQAMKHAEFAFDGRATKPWFVYSILAGAHAECGRFEKARELQEQAISLNSRDADLVEMKSLYDQGKPYRFHSTTP